MSGKPLRDLVDTAALAAQHVPSQCRCAAPFDGGRDFQLAQAQMAALLLAKLPHAG